MIEWFNIPGLIFVALIMVPNIIYARKHPEGFKNRWNFVPIIMLEQAGRYASILFMIVVIPECGPGFESEAAFFVYLAGSIALIVLYSIAWLLFFNGTSVFRALVLSVLPSALFLFDGVMSGYAALAIAATVFAPCHILLSYKNALLARKDA